MKVRLFTHFFILMLTALIMLSGCQGAAEESVNEGPQISEAAVEENTAVPPTIVPATAEPTMEAVPVETALQKITSPEQLVGVWEGTVAGEKGYVMYTDDGRYTVALVQDDLGSAPRVQGEYWFEDEQIHLRDVENAGHWMACPEDIVGIYEVMVGEDGQVQFQTVEDGCNEGGFTRNYIFANMVQELVGEPVPLLEAEEGGNLQLEETLQAILDQNVADGAPSAVLMVDAPDMNFSWKGAAGMADPELGIEMVADDQFIISSMTKMYTAVTILKLVEEGLLTLDDPISQYLSEDLVASLLVLDGESYGEEITIRQLLSHTSGLSDFSNGTDEDGNGLPDFKDLVLGEPDTVWTTDAVLEWAVENVPPLSLPGEGYSYSDTNFQLLGQIIESVSGLSLPEAYRQMIFTPLGMEHTYFEFNEEVVPGVDGRPVSQAFYFGNNWNELDSHSYEWGSGGLVSTVEDQTRFIRAWADGELITNPALQEAMTSWVETPDAGVYYGLGIIRFVFDEWDIPGLGEAQGHGGLFNSQAFYWLDQNMTIVGTLNSNEPQFGFIGLMLETFGAFLEHLPG